MTTQVMLPDEIPGEGQRKRAFAATVLIEWILLAMVAIGFSATNWKMVFAALISLVLALVIEFNLKKAWKLLVVLYQAALKDLGRAEYYRDEAREERDAHVAFTAAYRPPQEQINAVLAEAARKLKTACEEEDNLHIKGMGPREEGPTYSDPESESIAVKNRFSLAADRCQRAVKVAKEEFWRLHKLAKDNGYTVHDSWQKYLA